MARTISTKLAVEGEAQYKQAIAACNSELSTLKSGLALVESEFRGNANSMEALTAKGAALDSMYKKQQEKVSTLEAALRNAQRAQEEYSSRVSTAQSNIERCERALETLRRSTGDTSREQEALTKELDKWNAELEEAQAGQAAAERGVQNWQKQLNNAKVELNGLSDEIDKNNGYLDEARNSADGCADSIDEFGNEVDKSKKGIEQLAAALAAAGDMTGSVGAVQATSPEAAALLAAGEIRSVEEYAPPVRAGPTAHPTPAPSPEALAEEAAEFAQVLRRTAERCCPEVFARLTPVQANALRRLMAGALDAMADGSVERDAMAVFCCIFAGQFYDDLCDYHQDDAQAIRAAVTPLVDGADTGDPHGKFLMICLQYDSKRERT